jgi:hypothetical protein
MEWVVWEYYDWDYDTVSYLHSLNYTPDEITLILFLAYHGHTQPMTIVHWRQAHISWMDITTVYLRLEPSVFFVDIGPEVELGHHYGHAYGYYHRSPHQMVLTDTEIINLVHLKVTSEAFNIPPVEVIKLRERGDDFNIIVQWQIKNGREIKTRKGRLVRERTYPDKPDKDRPDRDRPDRDKPDRDKPDVDRPDNDKPDKDKPNVDKPDKDKPDRDKPDVDEPDKDKPDKDKPDKDKPDKSKPGKNNPAKDKPDDNKPNNDNPDKDKPDKDKSDKDK